MRTQAPIKSPLSRSMRDGIQIPVAVLGVALFMLSFTIGFEVAVATALSASGSSVEMINRTQKGDRLAGVPHFTSGCFERASRNQRLAFAVY